MRFLLTSWSWMGRMDNAMLNRLYYYVKLLYQQTWGKISYFIFYVLQVFLNSNIEFEIDVKISRINCCWEFLPTPVLQSSLDVMWKWSGFIQHHIVHSLQFDWESNYITGLVILLRNRCLFVREKHWGEYAWFWYHTKIIWQLKHSAIIVS